MNCRIFINLAHATIPWNFCSYDINCRISINWANSRLLVQWNGTVYYCECYLCIYIVHSFPSLFPPPFLIPSYSQGHVSPSYTATIQPLHPLPTYTENFCFLTNSCCRRCVTIGGCRRSSRLRMHLSICHCSYIRVAIPVNEDAHILTSSSFFCFVAVPIPSPIIIS